MSIIHAIDIPFKLFRIPMVSRPGDGVNLAGAAILSAPFDRLQQELQLYELFDNNRIMRIGKTKIGPDGPDLGLQDVIPDYRAGLRDMLRKVYPPLYGDGTVCPRGCGELPIKRGEGHLQCASCSIDWDPDDPCGSAGYWDDL